MSEIDQNSADRQIRELVVQIEGLRAMIREREGMIASIQGRIREAGEQGGDGDASG